MLRASLRAAQEATEGRPPAQVAAVLLLTIGGSVGGAFYGCGYNRDRGGPCWIGAISGYFLGGIAGSILALPLVDPSPILAPPGMHKGVANAVGADLRAPR
jgi:hypothetical protein